MSDPKVSVLVICFNQERYIRQTLISAVEQDYGNLQVIVADDGSSDETPRIVRYLASRYQGRIVPVLGKKNVGITRNCNRGLQSCNGKYLALLGGDDLMLPEKVRRQVAWLEADDDRVLCGHDTLIIDEKDQEKGFFSYRAPLRQGIGQAAIIRYAVLFAASSIMVRTANLPEYGFDERVPILSDWKLQVDCLSAGGKFGHIQGVYGKYRVHSAGVTNSAKMTCYYDALNCIDVIRKQYPVYHKETILRESEYKFILSFLHFKAGHVRKSFQTLLTSMRLSGLRGFGGLVANVLRPQFAKFRPANPRYCK